MREWLEVVLAAVFSFAIGRTLAFLGLALARLAVRRRSGITDAVVFEAARRPLRVLLASLAFREIVSRLQVAPGVSAGVDHLTFALIVLTIAWFAIRSLGSGVAWASARLLADPEHEIQHRVLRTQLTLLRQIATAVIVVVASAAGLMQFALVRTVGLSMLASAGLVGIVFGFAAQKPLSSLIAGIQLSITQPIRIGDLVLIEKELGTVEKIHLTYVVVRLREQRMLVIPVSRFLDMPFENWTFAAPDVVGSVLISVDFATPIEAVRGALARACAAHDDWDHKTCSLEVTDVTERAVVLRALVSSSDAAKNWTLRCFVRERLIGFLSHLDGGIHLPHDRSASVGVVSAPMDMRLPALAVPA
jgi:small-conductance mechanosensitive channel